MRTIQHGGSTWEVEMVPGGTMVVPTDPKGPVGRPLKLMVFREQAAGGDEYTLKADREIVLAELSDPQLVDLLQLAQEEEQREY